MPKKLVTGKLCRNCSDIYDAKPLLFQQYYFQKRMNEQLIESLLTRLMKSMHCLLNKVIKIFLVESNLFNVHETKMGSIKSIIFPDIIYILSFRQSWMFCNKIKALQVSKRIRSSASCNERSTLDSEKRTLHPSILFAPCYCRKYDFTYCKKPKLQGDRRGKYVPKGP